MLFYIPFILTSANSKRLVIIPFFLLLVLGIVKAQPSAQGLGTDYLATVENNAGLEPSTSAEVNCNVRVPKGSYVLAESFFENIDYVMRRVAFLKAYGFEDVTFTHTSCQRFDVDKQLYIVLISKPVRDKSLLYQATDKAYERAVREDIKLINARIVYSLD